MSRREPSEQKSIPSWGRSIFTFLGETGVCVALNCGLTALGAVILAADHTGYDATDAAKVGALGGVILSLSSKATDLLIEYLDRRWRKSKAGDFMPEAAKILIKIPLSIFSVVPSATILKAIGASSMQEINAMAANAVSTGIVVQFLPCCLFAVYQQGRSRSSEQKQQNESPLDEGLLSQP